MATPDTPSTDDPTGRRARAEHILRRHVQVYLALNLIALVGILLTGVGWLLYWPILAWSVGLMAHWLYVRSAHVDEAWAEERMLEVRGDAYDLAHIQDIERRYQDKPGAKPPARPAGRPK